MGRRERGKEREKEGEREGRRVRGKEREREGEREGRRERGKEKGVEWVTSGEKGSTVEPLYDGHHWQPTLRPL